MLFPMTVSEIIAGLGGTSKVAKFAGWPTSTVDSWITANHVPEWRRPALLRMAIEKGLALSTADFPEKPARAAA